jgi:hypothetical protein
VAAYAAFAPFVPEPYTSPGPSTIYFDKNSKRLKHPEIRQKPDMAAMDGANNTFFSDDAAEDDDDLPNFFGTSAAAPHAAGIAALVLDAAGGRGKVNRSACARSCRRAHSGTISIHIGLRASALSRSNLFAITHRAIGLRASAAPIRTVFTLTQFGSKRLKSLSLNLSAANPTETPGGPGIRHAPGTERPALRSGAHDRHHCGRHSGHADATGWTAGASRVSGSNST